MNEIIRYAVGTAVGIAGLYAVVSFLRQSSNPTLQAIAPRANPVKGAKVAELAQSPEKVVQQYSRDQSARPYVINSAAHVRQNVRQPYGNPTSAAAAYKARPRLQYSVGMYAPQRGRKP